MKRILMLAVACFLGLGVATTASADPIAVGDSRYIGLAIDGAPASAAWEVEYINFMIALPTPGYGTMSGPGQQIEQIYRSSRNFGPLPTAVLEGAINGSDPTTSPIDTTGWVYLLARYGGWSHVWYVAGLESAEIPATASSGRGGDRATELSHYSRYNYSQVPDGGTTLVLLGAALVGVGVLRRRLCQ